ncbi:TetR/AcrR family transcriptional regulator [Paenarthrobacter sp. NPDC057355]|uniref:TetR/AcrR family transcriptional regulator n=1 Tax=Paenarthrobacter sp. NPDC057355 TaxID=3346105 RepID=UPI00362B44BB
MSFIPLQPDAPLGTPGLPHERSDAARNRERLLCAARELVDEFGADALTMDALACKAKVGKGTVFRRFGSRAGLMMTLLSDAESDFQRAFMFGPPPLGPGASPKDRLVAFGEGRIYFVLENGELLKAAGAATRNRFDVPATKLSHRHMEVLLREAGIADPWVMAMSLTYALDPERIVDDVRTRGISPTRLTDSWGELITRLLEDK